MIHDTLIRKARLSDAGAIGRIYVESWRVAYKGILPQDYLDGLRVGEVIQSVRRTLSSVQTQFLIAEDERGAVGYISAGPERSQDPIYRSELYELYLLPEAQRAGLGSQLLARMARQLHQMHFYTLLVWVLSRNPNRRFYEKCGALYLRSQTIVHSGRRLQAVAYGWIDITMAM